MKRELRIVIADDSELFREFLVGLADQDPGLTIVAACGDGDAAADAVMRLRPDVVTMDLHMPKADGFRGVARIMAEAPTPILVLTIDGEEAVGVKALSLGALDILVKPRTQADLVTFGELLRERLRLLAGVRVIRHPRGLKGPRIPLPRKGGAEFVAVGASLGGPHALFTLLCALPKDFRAPVAVVQHIADGFTSGLAKWLDSEANLAVREAKDGDPVEPGVIVLAPSRAHLVVEERRYRLSDAPPVETFRPSVTSLFRSAAREYGARACGVILTGMGRDGAEGLRAMKDAGAATIAQDEASSAVFGMPRAAIELGAVDQVLPLEEIARAVLELIR